MYDLYRNDHEIEQALYAKGIDSLLIPTILQQIKQPAWQKRLRQAKRMTITGTALTAGLLVIYLLLTHIPDGGSLLKPANKDERLLLFSFYMYREIFYFVCFAAIVQMIAGIISYYHYKKLLTSNRNTQKTKPA